MKNSAAENRENRDSHLFINNRIYKGWRGQAGRLGRGVNK